MLLYTTGGLDREKSHHLEFISTSSGKMVIDYALITGIKSKTGCVHHSSALKPQGRTTD